MLIKEVSLSYTATISLGNYSSAKIGITYTAIPDVTESPDEVQAQLLDKALGVVRAEAKRLMARNGARVDEIFAGLPVEVQRQIKE